MKKTLLIADDTPAKTVMLRHFLHKADWDSEVVTADTTEEAMRLIDTNNITFAFVDYYIPSQNGPAIIAYLKKKNPSARAVLVSSGDKKSNFEEATAAGAETCICTSYRSDDVEKAVMDVIEEWKM